MDEDKTFNIQHQICEVCEGFIYQFTHYPKGRKCEHNPDALK